MGVYVLLPGMWSTAVLDVSRRSRGTDFADQLRREAGEDQPPFSVPIHHTADNLSGRISEIPRVEIP